MIRRHRLGALEAGIDWRSWQAVGHDGAAELIRCWLRRNPQLAFEGMDALPVLAQGCRALAGLGVELHQLAVRGFVEAVKGERLPGIADRWLECCLDDVGAH